jgi:type IV pilus assembly protein PilQ
VIRGLALVVTVVAAGTLASASGLSTHASATTGARLKISSRVSATGASLVIEATEPVPYVATRPDDLTVLLDFHNVTADRFAYAASAGVKGAIASVAIEPDESKDEAGSRLRITLAEPVKHRVRSNRNTIIVEFDKLSGTAAALLMPSARPAGDVVNPRGAPDAFAALTAAPPAPEVDPITALGLNPPAAKALKLAPAAVAAAQVRAASQQPQAPPAPRTAGPQPSSSTKRFSGHPVSLDFQGADLRAVLRTFSEISGLNVVIDPAVTGSVDVALRDVPWDQALDIILRANKLGYLVDGTIVRIAPLAVLADEEVQRRKLSEEQALSGELRVITKTLSYAKAEELNLLLTKSALSSRGTVTIDARTNTLIISDLQERLTLASDLIATLDRPQPQVEIEARIVQLNKSYERQLGIQWGFTGKVDPTLGNTTNAAFPNSGKIVGGAGAGAAGVPPGTAVNLGAAGASSAVGLALGSINGAFNLDVALSALETSGHGRLLSTPRVSTQNNIMAEIAQGVQIPYQTTANNTVTTQFKDAALTLKVLPQITAAGTVIMTIAVDNGSVGEIFPSGISINTQRANTTVMVNDGQTTVIGGIYSTIENTTSDRTPGLGSIPLLKWLFRRDLIKDSNRELLIFITPRIIKN